MVNCKSKLVAAAKKQDLTECMSPYYEKHKRICKETIMASDMQDDLRKMIERLIKQKRGPIRKGPIKRKRGTDAGPI
jgi:hypothetical protein